MATLLHFIQGSMYQLVYASSHILDKPFGSSWWSTYVQSENLNTFWWLDPKIHWVNLLFAEENMLVFERKHSVTQLLQMYWSSTTKTLILYLLRASLGNTGILYLLRASLTYWSSRHWHSGILRVGPLINPLLHINPQLSNLHMYLRQTNVHAHIKVSHDIIYHIHGS